MQFIGNFNSFARLLASIDTIHSGLIELPLWAMHQANFWLIPKF